MDKFDSLPPVARDILSGLGLLTRLPLPAHTPRGAEAAWAWPVAGACIGALVGVTAAFWLWIGLAPGIVAGLVLAMQAMLTGAMHEDGLADCADGFWGGFTRERRLAIMKDSQIGTYGTLALIFVTLLRWQCLALLLATGHAFWLLIGIAALSRAPMAILQSLLPNARGTGLSSAVGRPTLATAAIGAALAALLALPGIGWYVLPTTLGILAVTLPLTALARAKIGGQTGDVLGASQQLAELAALIVLVS